MPMRVQRSRASGWQMPPNTVYVGRPGKWGNPFEVGIHGPRAVCVELYRRLAAGYLCISNTRVHVEEQRRARVAMTTARRELRGKNLACWCSLDGPCHADVLLEIANA